MNAGYKRAKSKLLVAALTLLMVFGNVVSPLSGAFYVYGASADVSNWEALRTAISEGKTPINVTANLYAEKTIEIKSGEIEIMSSTGKTIFQKERTDGSKYETMFKVSGGTLTLGEGLTLSGKTSKCTEPSLEPYAQEIEITVPGDAKAEKISKSSGKGKFTFANGNLGISKMAVLKTDSAYDFEVKNGYLKANVSGTEYFVNSESNGNYMLRTSLSPGQSLQVVYVDAVTGGRSVVSVPKNGETYYIYDPNFDGLLGWDGNYIVSQSNGSKFDASNAIQFTYTESESGETYWVVPGTEDPKYDSEEDPALVAAMKEYNDKNSTVEKKQGWVIAGQNYFDETEAKKALEAITTPGQGCDETCAKYTKENFESGSTDAPHGFFVQVESGSATLKGATLENFNTSTEKTETPKHVAPVVANGEGATFNVENGNIQNNIVGYILNDSMSEDEANAIKLYVKGAAPNAKRAKGSERRGAMAGIDDGDAGSGITGTAGAVIYAGKAQGTISGGSLGFNRGDTGAVMVTDSGSHVTLEGDADINNNVGAQFGGGVTVENGGAVTMKNGTINNNVAWFGGGAVFATENGIDWLMGNQDKSERTDGVFTLIDGDISGNHAFTRGGGFLVDSDGVSLLGGKIHDNTSRVIGGAAYVMGDHADYTYKLYIAEGDISGNEAVSASTPEPSVTETAMSQKLKSAAELGCKAVKDGLFDGVATGKSDYIGATTDDIKDFLRINDGTGGGVWTCAYGTTILDLTPGNVTIHDNTAENATGDPSKLGQKRLKDAVTKNKAAGGNDLHADNGGSGSIIFLPEDGESTWKDENKGGDDYKPVGPDPEIRNLTNESKEGPNSNGVQIYKNASRRGGGIGADGTLVFGTFDKIARLKTNLGIGKTWSERAIKNKKQEPVLIEVNLQKGDKSYRIDEIELDGEANFSSEESAYENDADGNKWSGGFELPITIEADGEKIAVFKIKDEKGNVYDPTNNTRMVVLAEGLANNTINPEGISLESDAEITFSEKVVTKRDNDGNATEYGESKFIFEAGTIKVGKLSVSSTKTKIKGTDDFMIIFDIEMPASVELSNDFETRKDIEISKKALGGKEIDGAEMKLTDSGGKVKEWISGEKGEKSHKLKLEPGKYTLEELVAPKGYQRVKTKMEFTVNEDGTVTLNTTEVDNGGEISVHNGSHVVLEDAPEKPEIEKYVNEAVHKDIDLTEIFKYDIIAYVTNDADKVAITDELNDNLQFVSTDADVKVADMGLEDNHKVTNNIKAEQVNDDATVASAGEEIADAEISIVGQTLTVTIADATKYRSHWVKVTFEAKIAEGKTLAELNYEEFKADREENRDEPNVGNAPVVSNEDHEGIPNKASYKIFVKPAISETPKYEDESNTVTVKPKEYPVKISKQALGDDTKELPGAEIKVTGPAGYEETWTSGNEPHELTLTPGEYELVEVVAPNGYNIATVTTTIKFTVDTDGNVKILGATEEYNGVEGDNGCKFEMLEPDHLVLKDTPNPKVKISKTDLEGEEVEGATIELKDSEGNLIDTWESTTEAHEVTLAPGQYEMKETVAPEGFNIVTTTIKFEVDHEGNVRLLTAEVDNGGKIELLDVDHIVLKDAPLTEVYFSKTDLEGEELEGAKMKLTDAEGNVIDEWTSTKEDHILKLADGEYILTEVVAPEGYQCVTTKMRFVVKEGVVTLLTAEVDNDGVIEVLAGNIIILKDAPEVQKEYEPKKPEGDSELPPEVRGANKKVDTGDNADIYIWIAIMIIAACAVTFGAIKRRRTN